MSELDSIDRRILDLLQQDGRLTMTELGERVGLSTSPCSQRVKRLEAQGVIKGYHARVNPAALGKNLLVFVEITLAQKSEHIFKKVRDELQNMPEVLECHSVSGQADYMLKVRVRDVEAYEAFMSHNLLRSPFVRAVVSSFVLKEIKAMYLKAYYGEKA